MTTDIQPHIRASRMRVARSRGAFSGLLLILLGAWAALIPFIGPYFNLAFTPSPNTSWHWTTERGVFEVLPGAAAALGGLLLMVSANRLVASFGGWLAAAGGAWLVVGPTLAHSLGFTHLGGPDPSSRSSVQTLEVLLFFFAIGAAILFLAALGLGRLSVHSVRDVRAAERRAAAEEAAAERAEAERANAERANAERASRDRDRDHDGIGRDEAGREGAAGPIDREAAPAGADRSRDGAYQGHHLPGGADNPTTEHGDTQFRQVPPGQQVPPTHQGVPPQGAPQQGVPQQGMPQQGPPAQQVPPQQYGPAAAVPERAAAAGAAAAGAAGSVTRRPDPARRGAGRPGPPMAARQWSRALGDAGPQAARRRPALGSRAGRPVRRRRPGHGRRGLHARGDDRRGARHPQRPDPRLQRHGRVGARLGARGRHRLAAQRGAAARALGGTFRRLERVDAGWQVVLEVAGAPVRIVHRDPAEAYGLALLHLVTGEDATGVERRSA